MADAYDKHGSLAVTMGMKAALRAMSDDIGIEVNSVDRAREPEAQAEATDRDGETAALGIQKPERWKRNFDVQGLLTDEAKFDALGTVTVEGIKYIVTNKKIGDKVRDFEEASCTLVAFQKIT
ncbi:MAG: hypothetical protein IT577_05410 [Verrucomicrobiae bacterium]|nr:hypothetical protein [Verrucomicrobiae bacterium]